jgi:hypothetical protein
MTDSKAFLGCGWSFPVGVDATGAIAEASYETDIEQAVLNGLSVLPSGRRILMPADPVIDGRDRAAIFADLLARVPGYVPEWTGSTTRRPMRCCRSWRAT